MEGKVAIVTGASSGIGEAISIKFASLGASVTLCGRDVNRLNLVLDKVVTTAGGDTNRFLTVRGDINNQSVRKQVIGKTIEKFGRLDILVVNAGITSSRQFILNVREESYNAIMDTNLKSAVFLIQRAIPYLEKSRGNIVMVSSLSTGINDPSVIVYTMSKVALDKLTKLLSVDLGQKGIRVNAVNPGFIPTRIMRHTGDQMDPISRAAGEAQNALQVLKTGRLAVEDVAEAVAFFASDAAGQVTGEKLYIDGGIRLAGDAKWGYLKTKL